MAVLAIEAAYRTGVIDFYSAETRRYNPDLAQVLRRDQPRIVVVGDSVCAAAGGWQDLLRARGVATGVDLINLSIPGAGFHEYAQRARAWIPRLKPRLVLIGAYVGNDLWNAYSPYPDRSALRGVYYALSSHLQFLKWVNSRAAHLPVIGQLILGPEPPAVVAKDASHLGWTPGYLTEYARDYPLMVTDGITLPASSAEQLARIDALMGQIAETARAAGARVVLVIFPSSAQVDRRYYPGFYQRLGFVADPALLVGCDRVQQELGARARRHGMEVLDPLSEMRASPENLYYLDNDHPSPAGHAWLCDWLARQAPIRELAVRGRAGG